MLIRYSGVAALRHGEGHQRGRFADVLTFYADCARQVAALQSIAQAHESPEEIDDGAQTAPSKRIIDQFPDYEGAKRTAGPQIATKIGVEAIRDQCPHFHDWLARLEQLGNEPGQG